jgi:hypothetical protein
MHDGVKTIVLTATGITLEFVGMVFDIQQGGVLILFGNKRPHVAFGPGHWSNVVLQGYNEDDEENLEEEEGAEAQQFGSPDKKYH